VPKAFVPLAGRPMLAWALDGALAGDDRQVIVVAPADRVGRAAEIVAEQADAHRVRVVAGGATRQASVAAGLALVADEEDVVLVHDAARPLTPPGVFDAVRAAVVATAGGVVPGLPLADTVKRTAGAAVIETVDRAQLAAVQTPQGFPAAALREAYAAAGHQYTDDAALFAAAGGQVTVVAGSADAFKITTTWDLRRAEQLLASPAAARTGIGVDVHAVDASRTLRLGGLEWPHEPGLAGHSDADVVCHAIADALLSAGGLGDLGSRFGTDREEEAGRAGLDFVTRAAALLAENGYQPVHVAVQVIGNRPRIAGRRDEMQAALAGAVGAPVSVSGTTTDGLGLTGRGEGVASIATALVAPIPTW
jgi:2-C-methyl-D-erythritol 4-phosphate cytidylyltransferase / 2-C-methyl-D-erythritol 2,4-cyclodiphosphate synthase